MNAVLLGRGLWSSNHHEEWARGSCTTTLGQRYRESATLLGCVWRVAQNSITVALPRSAWADARSVISVQRPLCGASYHNCVGSKFLPANSSKCVCRWYIMYISRYCAYQTIVIPREWTLFSLAEACGLPTIMRSEPGGVALLRSARDTENPLPFWGVFGELHKTLLL